MRQILPSKVGPRTEIIKIFIMAVDPEQILLVLMMDAPLVTRLILDSSWKHPCVVHTASNVASSTEELLCGILHLLIYVILLITFLFISSSKPSYV